MDQASILILGFMGPLILGCIIGIIYALVKKGDSHLSQ
jgi:hypothetical protein